MKNATLFPSPTDIYNVSYGGLIKSALQYQTRYRNDSDAHMKFNHCDNIFTNPSNGLRAYFQRTTYVVFP